MIFCQFLFTPLYETLFIPKEYLGELYKILNMFNNGKIIGCKHFGNINL
jgi:hypothetical protein